MENTLNNEDLKLVNLEGLPASFFEHNRNRFFDNLNDKFPQFEKDSIVILEGGKEIPRHDTDTCFYHFIQENYFYYLSGVTIPDFHLIVDLKDRKVTLFYRIPNLRYKIFMHVPTLEEVTKKHNIECYDDKTIISFIKKRNAKNIYRLKGTNTDSGIEFKKFSFKENFESSLFVDKVNQNSEIEALNDIEVIESKLQDGTQIYEVLADTRTVKSNYELQVLKFTSEKTVEAHIEVMKNIKPGHLERDAENFFTSYLKKNYYTRDLPYFPICGCCEGAATLHYIKNDEELANNQLILLDMGARLGGYCSDITITIPVNGKFSPKQKFIYDTVLMASKEVMKSLKAGVLWSDMHLLAERVILSRLQEIGILSKDYSVDELLEKRVAFYFMPHGLGHLIGLDVHDVGGYLSFTNDRLSENGLRNLRTRRNVVKNSVLTVEPGLYFIKFHLEKAFNNDEISKYFNKKLICEEYLNFGGVRIEDVVLVTEDSCVNFSEALPRETEEIEKIMQKK